jgi:hypothetical protein
MKPLRVHRAKESEIRDLRSRAESCATDALDLLRI